jgi:sirohydrochlorin ferrochelatase
MSTSISMADAIPKTAIILIAHGSREEDANADLRHLADDLKRHGAYDLVSEAYLELAPPTIEEAAASCIGHGARRLILLPHFLSAGVHIKRDLASIRTRLAERFPDIDVRLADPIGRHPLLLQILRERAAAACPSTVSGVD